MEERFISVQEAQDILRVSTRQVQYHAANGKIGSRKIGRRLELLYDDVVRLAEELGSENRRVPQPSVEMVQDTGALIDYLREKDQQLLLMSRRVGELEGLLQQRLLPEDVESLRQELAEQKARAQLLEEEAERLREQLRSDNKPWYKRLFG